MNMIKDWIWCQYTPGAAGKLLCAIIQLSPKVHAWDQRLKEGFELFLQDRIMIAPETHFKQEINFPYDLFWYTRQLPFTRGDDLTKEKAHELFNEKNRPYDQYLNMPWTKPYLPEWFEGRCLTVVNDHNSLDFLRRRRDAIFYKWEGKKVHFKRFNPETCANPDIPHRFSDHPPLHKVYDRIDDFYEDEFNNHPEVQGLVTSPADRRVVLKIKLSDLWTQSSDVLIDGISEQFSLEIDRNKARQLVNHWLENNKDFL